MSQQGEAAEQIVNMATNVTVKGVECLTSALPTLQAGALYPLPHFLSRH